MNLHNVARMSIAAICLVGAVACVPTASANSKTDASLQQQNPLQEVQQLIANQKWQEAETILVDFVEKNPSSPGGWFQLGYVRHVQKNYSGALQAYEKAAAFPAVKPTALFNTGCIYSLQNDLDKSIANLKAAVAAGFKDREQFYVDADLATVRKDTRFDAIIPPLLEGADLFVEPTKVIATFTGENAGDQFGWTARCVGDLDGDKVIDFVATAPAYNNGAGKVYVYSSKTQKLLFSYEGKGGQRVGNIATAAGDINADGTPDVLIGAPRGISGAVIVLSGKDGKELLNRAGDEPATGFGYKACAIGDINGDKFDDVAVTALTGNGAASKSGKCYGISGKDGSTLFTLDGEATGDQFGSAISCDVKSKVMAVGAQNAGEGQRGCTYLYSLESGKPKLMHKLTGDAKGANFGQMFLSFPGDYDKDGRADVFVSDFNSSVGASGGGQVYVFATGTGKELFHINGTRPGENLGTSVSDAGDCNGDGIGDLIVGAWQNNSAARSGGKCYLFSGADQKVLATFTCKQPADTFGFDATGIGDVDGDGSVDFLITSAWSPVKGQNTGRVFIISGPKVK